jgi:hypothetical protein
VTESTYKASLRVLLAWFLAMGGAVGIAFYGLHDATLDFALFGLGILFAGGVINARLSAGLRLNVMSLLLVVWAGTFPLWAYFLSGHVDKLIHHTLIAREVITGPQYADLRLPAFIVGASMLTASLVRLATLSGAAAAQVMLAGFLAAGSLFVPQLDGYTTAAAAIVWHAFAAGAVGIWALSVRRAQAHASWCGSCGSHVRDLSSPVCTKCGRALVRGEQGDPLSALARAKNPSIEPENPFLKRNPYLN